MHSPTGYYALITTARYIPAASGEEVLDWSVTDPYPVVGFTSGSAQIVDRHGDIRLAKEYVQGIREGYQDAENARFEVGLDVTPHHTPEGTV